MPASLDLPGERGAARKYTSHVAHTIARVIDVNARRSICILQSSSARLYWPT